MKHVFAPHLGHDVRIGGRKIPRVAHTTLKFKHLVRTEGVVAPPPSLDFTPQSLTVQRNIELNDQLGDCVIAGRAHRIGLITGAAGTVFAYTQDQVLKEYERIGGYVPGDSNTDQGCDMTIAAEDGVKTGYADGSKDVGFVTVDASNKNEVMTAFYLLENGDLGLALPDAWINPFPDKDDVVWDVAGAPDPENGHCVQVVGYDATKGVRINTWGLFLWVTWPALAKYAVAKGMGELIVHANADQIAKATAKSPEGFDWATVVQFFDTSLGGTAPLPPAPLPPAPTPGPGGGVTLAQAEAAVVAGITAGSSLQTRSGASSLAKAALAKLTGWPT
jgi:hypothetical protein